MRTQVIFLTSSPLCILSSTLTQLYVPMVIPKDLVITAKPSPSLISVFGIQDLNYTSCLISSLLLVPQSQQCSSLVGTCKASIPLLMTPSCLLSLRSLNSKFSHSNHMNASQYTPSVHLASSPFVTPFIRSCLSPTLYGSTWLVKKRKAQFCSLLSLKIHDHWVQAGPAMLLYDHTVFSGPFLLPLS